MAATFLHFISQPNSPLLQHLIFVPKQTGNNTSKLLLHNLKTNHNIIVKCNSSSSSSSTCSNSSSTTTPVPAQGEGQDFPSPSPDKVATNSTSSYNSSTTTPVPSQAEGEDFPSPSPDTVATNSPESFPIEKRRKSEILRERRSRAGLVKPEPPNFQVGWKRTKEIKLEKPVGFAIMDFLDKLQGLMERDYGSTALLAKVGEIVAERAREEAEVLRDEGKVEGRMVTELSRVLRLMEMDLAMVKASVKEDTLSERLEQAKARCRQAILVANSF